MAEEENLVLRRPKRSTAGNRMELALAELALEETPEAEEDIDFVVEKEEEDIFESDFASTDEEAAQEDVDEGDRAAREEERKERKTFRARIEKATAAAHARQRVTFNPEASASQPRPAQKPKRRVSLGVVMNAETGEVIEGGAGTAGAKRQSQRRYTVMNTSATVNRIKDAEEKRAAIPKKTKIATRLPTQDELIARALDTEEGNISEHKNYLRLEEEKRAKARVVKQAIEGPVLRWVSKKETIQVEVQLPPPPPPPPTTTVTRANLYTAKYSFVYTSGIGSTVGSQAYSVPFYAYAPFVTQNAASKPQEVGASASATVPASSVGEPAVSSADASTASTSLAAQTPPSLPSTSSSNVQDPATPTTGTISSSGQLQLPQAQSGPQPLIPAPAQIQTQSPPVFFSYPPTPTAPFIAHRSEDVCKNYVIHELSQSVPSKPPWIDTMSAMFGDHVKWDEVRVFTGKGRPLSRPVRICPITGQPAKYCDPRSNVPFANVGAYEVLTNVIGRGYVWCSALGCYVGVNEASQRGIRSGGETGRSKNTGTDAGIDEEQEDGDAEEGLEERTTKRRRVEVGDG
ncbi:YL1 nuclear domain containing protein [Tylopilus felleus]